MKMLFLTEKFPPSEGGSRVYYYNLCKNYPHDKVLVLTKKVPGYEEFDRKQPFKIIRKNKPISNWKYHQIPRFLPTLFWATYLCFKEKIDIVHAGDFLPGAAIALFLKKLLGVTFVYYVHGEGKTWYKQYRFQPKLRKIFLEKADRIVAACSFAQEDIKEILSDADSKLVRINPGVDFEKFDPSWIDHELLQKLDLQDEKIILTIGRLVERKGQDTVIRAMPKILAEVPDAVYLVAGRGPYENVLKDLAKELGVSEKVKFIGYVPDAKVKSLYSICDLFVMINRETLQDGPEGFGMVFTEASAAGKPVIGGRSGGNEDSILDGITGFRVDSLDVDGVAASIINILKDDSLRMKLGQNGRQWVESNFDWREKGRQLFAVNKSIMDDIKKRN